MFGRAKQFISTVTLALGTLLFSSCNSSIISGAGASFPSPFYIEAAKQYATDSESNPDGIQVSYGAVGSGAGIRNLQDYTVDFGASDVFLSDSEMDKMEQEVLHISTCIGGIVMAYNLSEVPVLNLSPEIITGIYLGKITSWDDPMIAEVNPDVELPNKPVTPIYRSDGSGTTAVFSSYMCEVDPEWETQLGSGKSVDFGTVGLAAKGNPGVAGNISEIDGSIGYIGSEYSLALGLPAARLKNASGNYVEANMNSISLSGERDDFPDDTRAILANSPHPDAYPISTMTWILVYKEQAYHKRSLREAKALQDWLLYLVGDEAAVSASKTHYSPLPASAQEKARKVILSMTYNGENLAQLNAPK